MEFTEFSYGTSSSVPSLEQNLLLPSIACSFDASDDQQQQHYSSPSNPSIQGSQLNIEVEENEENQQQQASGTPKRALESIKLPKKERDRRIQPFYVQRVAAVSYIDSLMTAAGDANNFILYGEIFCYLKAFSSYRRINQNASPTSCYLSDFRPVLHTQVRNNNMICAELDPQDSIEQRFQNSAALVVAEQSSRKIDEIITKLRSLSDLNAYTFTKYLEDYKKFMQSYAEKVQAVHTAYLNDLHAIQEVLADNFTKSQAQIMDILEKIEKSSSVSQQSNVILQFFVKRLDARTLTNKTCQTGGNAKFMELISGTRDTQVVQYYFSKFGTPEVLDWKGIVEITLAQFSGNRQFEFDLQTIDGYSIPAKATYSCVSLSPIEIIPGFELSDVLEIYVYDINPEILKCLKAKRMLTIAHNRREDISYTIKSEIFVQRFYPELQPQLEGNSNRKTRSKKDEADDKREKEPVDPQQIYQFSQPQYQQQQQQQLQQQQLQSTLLLQMDPQMQQEEIQSDIYRINRQVNQKNFEMLL